ncbi:hypothetical protein Tco_0162428 [Tanacetum coccineum]
MINDKVTKPKVNFRTLESDVHNEANFDVKILIALVEKFLNAQGADDVLRNGRWMIRGIPVFLNKWSPYVSLTKEELSKRRSSYARAMVDIDARKELIDTLIVVIPKLNDTGYICMRLSVVKEAPTSNVFTPNDSFQFVKKHGTNRQQNEKRMGFKPKSKLVYRHVSHRGGFAFKKNGNTTLTSNVGDKINEASTSKTTANNGIWEEARNVESKSGEKLIEDSESDVEVTYDESAQFMATKGTKEGSGIRNKNLYEQLKETMVDDEYDPYDDDYEYNTHDLSEQQVAFCDAFDIKLRGQRKK